MSTIRTGKHITYTFWVAVTIIPIAGIIWGLLDAQSFAETQSAWREFASAYGLFAPLVFVIIQALQVVITPVNHYSIGVAGGFLFGPYLGALLNWVGRMIGHVTAYTLASRYGRTLAERYIHPNTLARYDAIVKNQSLGLFVMYFLPFFPDDEMSYIAGLSRMRFRMFLLANAFGHVGGSLGLAYIGAGIDTRDPLFWILFIVTLLGFPLLWYLLRRNKQTTTTS